MKGILELVKNIDNKLKKREDLTEGALRYFFFMDKENKPYVAIAYDFRQQRDNHFVALSREEEGYDIKVFSYNKLENKTAYHEVAHAIFSVVEKEGTYNNSLYPFSAIYLARLGIDDSNYRNKGIATNLLKIVELFAMNLHKTEVCAIVVPYGPNKRSREDTFKFYSKNGFLCFVDKDKKLKAFEEFDIAKNVSANLQKKLKLQTINYPVADKDYTLIIPENRIVSSHYQGMEKDK